MDESLDTAHACEWLFDMHTHLGFAHKPFDLAHDFNMHHIAGLCATVTPHEYQRISKELSSFNNIQVGIGAHPWWIHENKISLEELKYMSEAISHINFIAEIGLDFSKRYQDPEGQERQLFWFKEICNRVSQCIAESNTKYVLSIHSVHATTQVLDILESYNLTSHAICIFHWFSGTHDELMRACRLGCYFSINSNLLDSKRSKSYIQTIPADHILLETDMPEQDQYWDGQLERTRLMKTRDMLKELKNESTYMLSSNKQAELLNITIN